MGVCGIYCWGLAQKHPTKPSTNIFRMIYKGLRLISVGFRTHISESDRHDAHKENELSKLNFENNEFMIYEQRIHHSI